MKKFVAIYLGSATALAQWKATDDQKEGAGEGRHGRMDEMGEGK